MVNYINPKLEISSYENYPEKRSPVRKIKSTQVHFQEIEILFSNKA